MLPSAIKHLLQIKSQLKNISYQKSIKQQYDSSKPGQSINNIVKSYFWGSRLIYNCHCLPRSIALYLHLKGLGYQVEHKFGVNKQNAELKAHAWVEYNNEALNESDDLLSRYKVLDKPNF